MNKHYPHIFLIERNGDIFLTIYKNDTKQKSCHKLYDSGNMEIESFLNFEVKFDKHIYSLFDKIIYCKDEI